MKITLNGMPRELAGEPTIGALLAQLGPQSGGIAVAHNERVVRRGEYATQRLCDGDRVEIITAAAGG